MEPSQKDLAEFALLGLGYRILELASVIGWADSLIANSDAPAEWIIDLALASPRTIERELNLVPGEMQSDLSVRLFLALRPPPVARAGMLSIGRVCSIGWSLFRTFGLRLPREYTALGGAIYCDSYDFENGVLTIKELRASIDEILEKYSDVGWMLPYWTEHVGHDDPQSVADPSNSGLSRDASNQQTPPEETDEIPLPTEDDFDPTGRDHEAHWAWVNLGGFTVQEAEEKLSDPSGIYPEAFASMGGRAFAFYFPSIDGHLRKAPEENDEGEYYGSSYLAHCINHQLTVEEYHFVLHLIPRMIALAQYVRQNISRFGTGSDELRRIDQAWIALENRIKIMSQGYKTI